MSDQEIQNINRAIGVKRNFIEYAMQRNKRLLGNRKAYIEYFLNVWLPENDPGVKMSEAIFELANYHLFVTERRTYDILKGK
ncbi:MAG: hypothetical protein MK105_15145 [Crocinitomicaceae bacterium]|nr:hypothetical protein [Crocinitomicaceae bacterium]